MSHVREVDYDRVPGPRPGDPPGGAVVRLPLREDGTGDPGLTRAWPDIACDNEGVRLFHPGLRGIARDGDRSRDLPLGGGRVPPRGVGPPERVRDRPVPGAPGAAEGGPGRPLVPERGPGGPRVPVPLPRLRGDPAVRHPG